jgi:hypothetical protein
MGLFGFLRGKDEKAIPDPGTPEFEAMVQGSAIPDSQSVAPGEPGWTSTADGVEVQELPPQTLDLRGTGAREKVEEVLRANGIDPDKQQQIDASSVPGLKEAILSALGSSGIKIPNAEGFGGGISAPKQDPLAQVEYLAKKREAGEITDAEFEAQKKQVLGE